MYSLNWFEQIPLKYSWLEDFGTYNKMPTPFIEIDENDYIILTRPHIPKYIEYRQVLDIPDTSTMLSIQIYWYHNFAIAIVYPGNWGLEDGKVKYHTGLRYFRIGCKHNFRKLTRKECLNREIEHYGMCYHVYECENCGVIEAYDSSD